MAGDNPRRLRLRLAVKAMAATMAALFVYLLIASVNDRERTPPPRLALTVTGVPPGGALEALWAGRRVLVLRRTPQMLASLGGRHASGNPRQLPDPDPTRLSADLLVFIGYGPGSGCPVQFVPAGAPGPREPWPGGFRDPCAGAWYDAAGRDIGGGPDLPLPPQRVVDDTLVIGGEEQK